MPAVSTDQQCERGVSLAAQAQKVRAMALVHGAELVAVIQEGGESAKTLDRPGMQRVLAMVDRRQVQAVIVAKLDRLTRSVRDLCELLELLERRGGGADFGGRKSGYRFGEREAGDQHHGCG
jgi:DNA invertase Pin-like site-specific DNA recombinase